MILAMECIAACALFTIIMVGGVIWKREAFLHEYAPAVQKRFLEYNPDYVPKEKIERTIGLILAKLLMSILFTILLTAMVCLAGARNFREGMTNAYLIWFVVNWYDVIALDMGIFAHWKKIRLPGTEDMDREYSSNAWKHIKDGVFGTLLGIPISCICGCLVSLVISVNG